MSPQTEIQCLYNRFDSTCGKATTPIFRGTQYEHNCYFYHNALTQMTNNETKEWMHTHSYLAMWLMPFNGCKAGMVYAVCPIGDSPEMMPLDSSLFEDLHASICHHATQMTLLENDDPKKFSLLTPKQSPTPTCACLIPPSLVLKPVSPVCRVF